MRRQLVRGEGVYDDEVVRFIGVAKEASPIPDDDRSLECKILPRHVHDFGIDLD
jgi:hypothetical protein